MEISELLKDSLHDSLWSAAVKLKNHFLSKKYKVTECQSIDSQNPYKVDFLCKKGYESIAIIIRKGCAIESFHSGFIDGCHNRRIPVKIFFAIPEFIGDVENHIPTSQKQQYKNSGIGLIIIGNDLITFHTNTVSCNRKLALDHGPSLGVHKKNIEKILDDYNGGNCINAIRDITELVEDTVDKLCIKSARKRKIIPTQKQVNSYDLNKKINVLSAPEYSGKRQKRYLSEELKNDLLSYKGTRNLSHHPRNKYEQQLLEQQMSERMLMGIRLIGEINRIKA